MKILIFLISIFFWSCSEESLITVNQHALDVPNSEPTINESNLMDGDDFTAGYESGNIRSDRVNLNWESSEDENFLAYKIFRAPELGDVFEGFEGGSIPSGWNEYGDCGGWEVTDIFAYEGSYSIASNPGDSCSYGYDYLNKTITVPQYEWIFISFLASGYSNYGGWGEGRFYINGSTYNYWYMDNWQDYSYTYYTGSNTEVTFQWRWYSEYYSSGLLDNIQISGSEEDGASYSLIETLNDKNIASFWDTTLTQNQFYNFKVASILTEGTHKVDDITIRTPIWQAPSNINYEILSPEVAVITWDDNSESEMNFILYNGETTKTVSQNYTSYYATDLDLGTYYQYEIQATNDWEETPVGYSSPFAITFNPPSSLTASQQQSSPSSKVVELNWSDNSNAEDGFQIERDLGSGFELLTTVDIDITSYTDTDTTNIEYEDEITYRVSAYNDYSQSVYTEYSNEVSITIEYTTFIYEDFENGFSGDWIGWGYNNYGDNITGWSISSSIAYEGNYSLRGGGGYYEQVYLEQTISVPQYTYIDILFYQYETDSSGDGDLYINGSFVMDWDTSGGWSSRSCDNCYYTGSNDQITLQWRYYTYAYGEVYLDNIQVTW